MKRVLCLAFFISILGFSCKQGKTLLEESGTCGTSAGFAPIEPKITVTQGIYGIVFFTEGSCMPSTNGSSTCRTCPVSRKLRVYEYATMVDAVPASGSTVFFSRLNTRLIMETNSDAYGYFQCTLPPGKYTLVVLENGLLYANFSDGQGGINPFVVEAGIKKVDFPITYKAAF